MPESVRPEERSPDKGPLPADPIRHRLVVVMALVLPTVFALIVALAFKQLQIEKTGVSPAQSIAQRISASRASVELAPAFALPPVQGAGTISLQRFRGEVVVLNFWASWCEPCREEAPQLEYAWQAFGGRGVQFLGVDSRDSRSEAIAFQRQYGITYPSVFDPQGRVSTQYRLVGIPTTIVIDSQGRVSYRFLGKVDAALLSATLEPLLADQPA